MVEVFYWRLQLRRFWTACATHPLFDFSRELQPISIHFGNLNSLTSRGKRQKHTRTEKTSFFTFFAFRLIIRRHMSRMRGVVPDLAMDREDNVLPFVCFKGVLA